MSKTITYKPRTVTDSRYTEEQLQEIDKIRPPDRIEPFKPGAPRPPRETSRTPVGPWLQVHALDRTWKGKGERLSTIGGGRDVPDDPAALAPYADAGTAPNLGTAKALIHPAEPAPGSVAAKVAYLKKLGIELIPTGDGNFMEEFVKGAMKDEIMNGIEAARPLLRAYLHGSPLRCAAPYHVGGLPPEATTLSLGGAPLCGSCHR